MKPLEIVGEAVAPDGTDLKLTVRDREYVILANGKSLMSSRMHGSEEALATLACREVRTMEEPEVLIGGLGMGFTLRATLEVLPRQGRVTVVELVQAVVDWNRGPLGPLARHPLADPRVSVDIRDVGVTLASTLGQYDAVMLDVDNGPTALASSTNSRLYDDQGLASARDALRPGGVLAVWSAHEDRKFEQRLRYAGFRVAVERVRGRQKKGGPRHTIFLGHRM